MRNMRHAPGGWGSGNDRHLAIESNSGRGDDAMPVLCAMCVHGGMAELHPRPPW